MVRSLTSSNFSLVVPAGMFPTTFLISRLDLLRLFSLWVCFPYKVECRDNRALVRCSVDVVDRGSGESISKAFVPNADVPANA